MALVLLRPRLANWRYKCGYRSLLDNLSGERLNTSERNGERNADVNDNEDDDVPYDEVTRCHNFTILFYNF